MQKNSKIFIAGHKGLVGSALLRELKRQKFTNLLVRSHQELDLTNQKAVREFFEKEKPEYVFLSAAKAGGIAANLAYRADFIYENLMIECNVIHHAFLNGVKKLLFLASTTIYPKNAPMPTKEESLLSGDLEYSNKAYAIAKIAGLTLCESYNIQYNTNFLTLVPINLYGNDDKFDLEKSHVLPAILRKMHLAKLLYEKNFKALLDDLKMTDINEAKAYLASHGVSEKSVEIWGSGKAQREFLHSDDLAKAALFVMQNVDFKDLYQKDEKNIQNTQLNVSTGKNITIKELSLLIQQIVGFKGELVFNRTKPDGVMQKLTDSSKLEKLGFKAEISLEEGITKMYEWYKMTYGGGGGI